MKKILGISAFYHDSAAALSIGGKIVAAAQEERFTRTKHTADFPVNAIKYCLDYAGISLDELDAIVFYDKPILKFERLLETYYAFAPRGIRSFLKSMPVWLDEKLFLKKNIYTALKTVGPYNRKKLNLQFTEHHLSHAASAFYTSPFNSSAILTIDGVGEWCTASICMGDKQEIKMLKEMHFPHSVGLLYSAFTYYLGFKVNSGEYKLMGLAPFGNANDESTKRYETLIKKHLVDIKPDGSIWLDQSYFNYCTGLKMLDEKKWETLLGLPKRKPESNIEQSHCNLALAIQHVTEEIVLKMAAEAKRISGSDYLCLAGGVALNCVANGKLLESGLFKDIYIQPAAGDAGGAIGAALASSRMYFNETTLPVPGEDGMQGAFLGPAYADEEIEKMCRSTGAVFKKQDDYNTVAEFTSRQLAEGKIIGWFQGRMEFGPRALGNRSILAYAGIDDMQEKINAKIKYREGFRPFAPAVLSGDASKYFDLAVDSPYMLFVAPIQEIYRKPLPDNYTTLSVRDKLRVPRSEFQAITHVDFSARVQSVHQETNPQFYALIESVRNRTGHGILVNTSFNVRGESVVNTPLDAFRCFMHTEIDYLVINNYIFDKADQGGQSTINVLNEIKNEAGIQAKTHKPERSVFTIAIALVVLYFIFQKEWFFNLGLVLALIGISSDYLNRIIDLVWMKFAKILNFVMPKIILSTLFYFILFPISVLSRLFSKKDPMMLQNKHTSTFRENNKIFQKESFGKMW